MVSRVRSKRKVSGHCNLVRMIVTKIPDSIRLNILSCSNDL